MEPLQFVLWLTAAWLAFERARYSGRGAADDRVFRLGGCACILMALEEVENTAWGVSRWVDAVCVAEVVPVKDHEPGILRSVGHFGVFPGASDLERRVLVLLGEDLGRGAAAGFDPRRGAGIAHLDRRCVPPPL